jgi:hypothetical protein
MVHGFGASRGRHLNYRGQAPRPCKPPPPIVGDISPAIVPTYILALLCPTILKKKTALDDLDKIRKAKSPSEKRDIGIILRAALGNARRYLSELVDSLEE